MATEAEKQVVALTNSLPQLYENLRMFSSSMRSLYAEKCVPGDSAQIAQFRELRDDTRCDAIAYWNELMPLTTDSIQWIADFFKYYEELDFKRWKASLGIIILKAEGCKQACLTLVRRHEAELVPLKQRQDKAKVMVQELENLEKEYQKEVARLEADAAESRGWAIGLSWIPIVNVIATPLLLADASSVSKKAAAAREDCKVILYTTGVTSHTLIPALGHFIDGLSVVAGFFEVILQELTSFKEKGAKANDYPKMLHYSMMKKKAVEIKGCCQGFYAVLPGVHADFTAICN